MWHFSVHQYLLAPLSFIRQCFGSVCCSRVVILIRDFCCSRVASCCDLSLTVHFSATATAEAADLAFYSNQNWDFLWMKNIWIYIQFNIYTHKTNILSHYVISKTDVLIVTCRNQKSNFKITSSQKIDEVSIYPLGALQWGSIPVEIFTLDLISRQRGRPPTHHVEELWGHRPKSVSAASNRDCGGTKSLILHWMVKLQ